MFTNYFAMSKKRKFYSIFMTNKKCVKIMKKKQKKQKGEIFFFVDPQKRHEKIYIYFILK